MNASEPISISSFNFTGVKNFLLNSEGRPRTELNQAIERRFAQSRLEKTVINAMFGHMINPMVTTRSYMNIEPVRLHLSLKMLRRGVVQITNEQDDPTGIWVEDSGIVSCTPLFSLQRSLCSLEWWILTPFCWGAFCFSA